MNVPESISHDEFLTAIAPLLDLLGVEPNEILMDIHITGSVAGAIGTISLLAVAQTVEYADRTYPEGIPSGALPGLKPAPQANGELVWPVSVKIGPV